MGEQTERKKIFEGKFQSREKKNIRNPDIRSQDKTCREDRFSIKRIW